MIVNSRRMINLLFFDKINIKKSIWNLPCNATKRDKRKRNPMNFDQRRALLALVLNVKILMYIY